MNIDAILLAAKGPKGDDGDPTLSADLTSTDPGKGAELVSRGSVTVSSFADIADVPAEVGQRGISINLVSYHEGFNKGGGTFHWDATSTDADDGGTIVTPSGHSGVGRWVRKLDGYVTPEMFGAKGDGVTDDSSAIVSMAGVNPSYMRFGPYNYAIASGISISLDGVLDASAATLIDITGLEAVITITGSVGSKIKLHQLQGTDDLVTHRANPNVYEYFFHLINCSGVSISGAYTSNKRTAIALQNCTGCTAADNFTAGFLDDITTTEAIEPGANFLPSIHVIGGFGNSVYGNYAHNHGSCVLNTSNGRGNKLWGNSGHYLHDNGVYVSSGDMDIAFGNSFRDVGGSGVKVRGFQNMAVLNTTSNCDQGIVGTGAGSTPDGSGANGHGVILAFNIADKSRARSVNLGVQQGHRLRDSIMAFNVAAQHVGTGNTNPPYVVEMVHGGLVVGNLADTHTADYTVLIPGGSDRSFGTRILTALNSCSVDKPVIRRNYSTDFVDLCNVNSVGDAVELRYGLRGVVMGNAAYTSPALVLRNSPTYASENLLIVGNHGRDVGIGGADTHVIVANNQLIDALATTYAPKRALLLAYDANDVPHISLPDGSGGFEWVELQVV